MTGFNRCLLIYYTMSRIVVTAPAHLHAGNMDLTGDLGRLYGTAGFTIDNPRTVVEVSKSNRVKVAGEDLENARRYVQAFTGRFKVEGGIEIHVKETIPKHLGMGSQTALALSIGRAIAELYKLNLDLEEIALALGRSDIVALGLNSFKAGGFIVDGGYRIRDKGRMIPPLLFRHPIPEDWLFIVCIPSKPIPGVLKIKAEEDRILEQLKPMPDNMSDRLSRLVLMQIMPSILEHDIESFGRHLTAFNRRLGGFWGGHQEGLYCHPIVERGVKLMLDSGAYGACQTCWGPTFYGLVDDEGTAKNIVGKLHKFLDGEGGGETFYTTPNNQGASMIKW
jgi:beta-ribofuranosylaminobenzene 5'-phosphate synthase